MKNLAIVFLMSFAVWGNAKVQSSLPQSLQVKELKLGNGMTVWINEDHSQPKVFGAVVVKAGSFDCPNTGIAHYFEHIMFKGTDRIGTVDYKAERPWLDSISVQYDKLAATTDAEQRSEIQKNINRLNKKAAEYAIPNEFNNLITQYGGSGLNAGTSYDFTFYHNIFSPQYIQQWAILNSERLLKPVFRLFQGELETVYEEKNRAADNLFSSAMEKIMDKAFAGTPYQYPIIGSTENLKNPQLSKMREFYTKYYVGNNMGLVLAGDVCADSIMPLLEKTFGRIPAGTKPEKMVCRMSPFDRQTYDIKINIPIISAEMLAFHGPNVSSEDSEILTLAMQLLNNGNGTGMLDSLRNENKLIAAMALNIPLKNAGLTAVGIIPNLLGKKSKAEDLCKKEIERLKKGDFSDEMFLLVRRNYERKRIEAMEDIAERAELMVNVFANTDLSWNEYVERSLKISNVTREDIQRVVNKYLNDDYIRFVKKTGSYEKEKLTQPGYSPVIPQHAGAESDFAKELAMIPFVQKAPRFVDFKSDAVIRQITPLTTLYAVPNPIDSLFSLKITYYRGKRQDPRLEYAAQYIDDLGTDSLSLTQFSRVMQRLGAVMSFDVSDDAFNIELTGNDSQFRNSLQMLTKYLDNVKADEKKLKRLKDEASLSAKSFGKESNDVEEALIEKLKYGENSTELKRMPLKDIKKLTSDELFRSVNDVRKYECSIVYSGTLSADNVEATVKEMLQPEKAVIKHEDSDRALVKVDENVVYVYKMDNARQNIIGTYQQLPATSTWEKYADRQLFTRYFGGGMSSLMFQEMREFRSLAYTVYGYTQGPVMAVHPNNPTAFVTTFGTQADKTLQAVGLLDSLLTDMPMRKHNVEIARQSLYSSITNSYPNFRSLGSRMAELKLEGYDHDINADLFEALKTKNADDVSRYFADNIKPAKRAWFIIGKLSKEDINTLSKYGKVVELKKEDLVRF